MKSNWQLSTVVLLVCLSPYQVVARQLKCDAPAGAKEDVWLASYRNAEAVALSRNGDAILAMEKDGLVLLDLRTLKPLGPRFVMMSPSDAAFSSDGQRIVAGGRDGCTRIFDTKTGKLLFEPTGAVSTPLDNVAFSPDGKRFLTAGRRSIEIYDAAGGKPAATIPIDGVDTIFPIAQFSPDGSKVVGIGVDWRRASIWDAQTGKLLSSLGDAADYNRRALVANCAVFSPDGRRIAVGVQCGRCENGKGMCIMYDGKTGKPLFETKPQISRVLSLAFRGTPGVNA